MFAIFKEFDESIESFAAYVNGLEQPFILYDVKQEKKVLAIISCMGPKLHNLLSDLSFPKASESFTNTEFVDLLLKHQNKFFERIKFRNFLQFDSESIQDFSATFKKMTTYCTFSDDTLNENLLEQFLRGLKNENIQN